MGRLIQGAGCGLGGMNCKLSQREWRNLTADLRRDSILGVTTITEPFADYVLQFINLRTDAQSPRWKEFISVSG